MAGKSAVTGTNIESKILLIRGQHGKYMPYAFYEPGALMLENVLESGRAVKACLLFVHPFVQLRDLVFGNKEVSRKFCQLKRKVAGHDRAISELINVVCQHIESNSPNKKLTIGFTPWKENYAYL